jgi:quercetin dioxygenase-like cupin family protein
VFGSGALLEIAGMAIVCIRQRTLIMSTSSNPMDPAPVATDLVAYQSGSIVSRILLKTSNGSVTAFAFDEGEELSEHSSPFDALIHVIEGEVEVRIAGVPHVLSAGQLIRLPANDPHAVRALKRFKMVLTMLKG